MTWLEQHPMVLALMYVSLALVVIAAALAVARGYFGTPQRRSDALLEDLEESDEVPRSLRRDGANCLGHSGEESPVRGTGVLYLTTTSVGFLLREPRHRIEIHLSKLTSVATSSSFQRPGFPTVELDEPALVLGWNDDDGSVAVIGWSVDDAAAWVDEIEALRRRLSGRPSRRGPRS